jgi:5-oxoprolinase (ATP-hydrolysing) subunit A
VSDQWVDLNADLGEEVTDDAGLLAVVTSANVACGYHAGTRQTMRAVCAEAARRGVSIGAQVSYDDRPNFGRAALDLPPVVLTAQIADQVGTLSEIAVSEGVLVRYVKPHGALYHRVIDDEEQAAAVLAGAPDLPVLGFPGSAILRLAGEEGRPLFREAFADRAYTVAGRLQSRAEPGSVLTHPPAIAARALVLVAQGQPTRVDSICVHGDSPGAVASARAVRHALEAAGWTLRGL